MSKSQIGPRRSLPSPCSAMYVLAWKPSSFLNSSLSSTKSTAEASSIQRRQLPAAVERALGGADRAGQPLGAGPREVAALRVLPDDRPPLDRGAERRVLRLRLEREGELVQRLALHPVVAELEPVHQHVHAVVAPVQAQVHEPRPRGEAADPARRPVRDDVAHQRLVVVRRVEHPVVVLGHAEQRGVVGQLERVRLLREHLRGLAAGLDLDPAAVAGHPQLRADLRLVRDRRARRRSGRRAGRRTRRPGRAGPPTTARRGTIQRIAAQTVRPRHETTLMRDERPLIGGS